MDLRRGGVPVVEAEVLERIPDERASPAEEAGARSDADAVRDVFLAGAPEAWRVERVAVTVDGGFFVPAAELKRLRREFWAFAAERLEGAPTGRALLDFYRDYQKPRQELPPFDPDVSEYRVPGFCAEGDLDAERARIREAYARGVRRFRACSWYAFDLLREFSDIGIVTAFPVPAGNSAGCGLLKKFGACAAAADPEITPEELAELRAHAPLPVLDPEPAPVLATRLELPVGEWTGVRGDKLRVRYDKREKLSLVFPEKKV